eukprot:scaffold485407_cov94-Attheya_sp.AAC.1
MVGGKINERIVHFAADFLVKTFLEPILDANAATVDHLGDEHSVLDLEFFIDLEVVVLELGNGLCDDKTLDEGFQNIVFGPPFSFCCLERKD